MDNKLTKRRLSDFLSYEWILILVCVVAIIIVWELIFTVSAVRVTAGQNFKYYIDQNVRNPRNSDFYSLMIGEGDDYTFSYDVLEFDTEDLTGDFNVLSTRLSVYEGDIIFTDSIEEETESEFKSSRAKTIIDGNRVYTFDHLLEDGQNYLKKFLKDGETDFYDYSKLDENKIKENFLARMKKDNRFRSDEQKAEGVELEKDRIKNLCDEIKKFNYLIEYGVNNPDLDLFYEYTKYDYLYNTANDTVKEDYKQVYEKEVAERKDARYGLNLKALTGGKENATEYFAISGKETIDGVVLMAFDFYDVEDAKVGDLQFETISFINRVVEVFSDIYSAI